MFSSRLPADLQPNRLSTAARRARAAGRPLLDLTTSNPTTVGIPYPEDMLEPLGNREARRYAPQPRGLEIARRAVAGDYLRRGIAVATGRLVLTASTSEAYSVLFKLLCAPEGDEVLVPAPSYPLFDHLTRLDGVVPAPYRLEYHGRWTLDTHSVEQAWRERTRAVLAVSPNNPTGSVLTAAELEWLGDACGARGAALIVDEVFADYPLEDPDGGAPAASPARCLTFRLGGLSKSAGLPQVKLGWIAVDGPDDLVDAALERLDLICDTYLSVATPVQTAAAVLMAHGGGVRAAIRDRVRRNYAHVRSAVARRPSTELLHADAGWSAVLRVPSTAPEETLALDLLERDGVLVYPGFFFDFAHEAFLVVSLLPPPEVFDEAIHRILERVDA